VRFRPGLLLELFPALSVHPDSPVAWVSCQKIN
jgi:hypothetical protein